MIRTMLQVLAAVYLMAAGPCLAGEKILVFAAASMRDALQAAGRDYMAANKGDPIVFSFASSSVLAKQIAAGAPADLFVSADTGWVDWLDGRGAVNPASRHDIAGNRLVIVRKAGSATAGKAADALAGKRFAMGDPAHVPAGRYAQKALQHEGLWDDVKSRAVFGENARVAVEYIRNGAVDAAIVYASDLSVYGALAEVYRFGEDSHPAIVYPAVIPAKSNGKALRFLQFLASSAGQAIFARYGFSAAGM